MKYLLDSNAIIALVMNDDPGVYARASQCEAGDMVTSAICYAEVVYSSVNEKPPATEQLHAFVEEVRVLDFDFKAAEVYASLPFRRASYDRLIAAHALSHGLIVVTDNETDFRDVPGLVVENWTV